MCLGAVWEHGEGASRELSGAMVRELGGMVVMMREMVEGQKELVEEIENLGELAESHSGFQRLQQVVGGVVRGGDGEGVKGVGVGERGV